MNRRSSQPLASWLLAVVGFLIVYGSLFPFHFSTAGVDSLGDLFGQLGWARSTPSDIASNLLLYLPLGACLGWLLAGTLGGLLAVCGAVILGALLSTGIELAQVLETRRVASLTDVASNVTGTFLGALLAMVLRLAQQSFRNSWLSRLLSQPAALCLLVLWVGYRLAPFRINLEPASWLASVEAVLLGGWNPDWAILGFMVPWLVSFEAVSAIKGDRQSMQACLTFAGLTLAGILVVSGGPLSQWEAAGVVAALLLTWLLQRMPPSLRAVALSLPLMLLVLSVGLSPLDFVTDRDAFALIPFGESLLQYRSVQVVDMFHKCFLYGGLVWLLARSGLRVMHATLVSAALVLGVEVLQVWLPGKTPDITDPLLVVTAGGLIALFDPMGRTGKGLFR
ncbi:MAG: VanZ family protein [Steroidobacteraceae bacterium]